MYLEHEEMCRYLDHSFETFHVIRCSHQSGIPGNVTLIDDM